MISLLPPSVVLVDEQIKSIYSNITTHRPTVRLEQSRQKAIKCSPLRQVNLESIAYRYLFLFLFTSPLPQPLSFSSCFVCLSSPSLFPLVRPHSLFPSSLQLSCFALTSLVLGLFFLSLSLDNLPSLSVAPLDFAVPLPA